MCASAHRYHPSQCSRSWHRASREHHPPRPSPGPWWHGHQQQTQSCADTHLETRKIKQGNRGEGQARVWVQETVRNNILQNHWAKCAVRVHPVLNRLWVYKCSVFHMFMLHLSVDGAQVLTSLVQQEVFIDDEGSLYWTVLVYLTLDLLLVWQHTVGRFTCNALWVRTLCCVCET